MNKIIGCIIVCMIGIVFCFNSINSNKTNVVHNKKCANCNKVIHYNYKYCHECIMRLNTLHR